MSINWGKAWRGWWQLSRTQRRAWRTAWILFWWIPLALRLLGYQRLLSLLRRLAGCSNFFWRTRHPLSAGELADQMGSAAIWHPLHPSCLPRSLVLWYLLQRENMDGQIRFGARMIDGRLDAHAWVEFAGVSLDYLPPESYASFEPAVTQHRQDETT